MTLEKHQQGCPVSMARWASHRLVWPHNGQHCESEVMVALAVDQPVEKGAILARHSVSVTGARWSFL
jgi:hypothetical protein